MIGRNREGRRGLPGPKTASLSQAPSVSVVTRRCSQLRGVRWDLDHLATTGKWYWTSGYRPDVFHGHGGSTPRGLRLVVLRTPRGSLTTHGNACR